MNILYFTTAHEEGTIGNRLHEEFLECLAEHGHRSTVLVPDAQRRGRGAPRVDAGPPPVVRLPVSATQFDRLTNRAANDLLHYTFFGTLLREYRAYLRAHPEFDVIHVESVYPLGALAALAGDPRPFIPTIRGADLIADEDSGYGLARFPVVRTMLRLAFRRAALVRAVSPGARDMAIQYGCAPEKIVVVPRNLRNAHFAPDVAAFRAASRAKIDARHGIAGHKIILTAGRLLPVKGFDDLIRAMPQILQRVPEATVLICGPNRVDERYGDYGAFLQRMIAEHGLQKRVLLVGDVPPTEMADYMAAADVVAVPSLVEGGNKTVVESTVHGTPYVATETSGTVGFFDGRQGLLVPVRDPQRLGEALVRVLSDAALWHAMSAACLDGRQRFGVAAVTDQMIAMYTRGLGDGVWGLGSENKKPEARSQEIKEHASAREQLLKTQNSKLKTQGAIIYIAYPTSLSLKSANAIQTWSTLRALRELCPDMLALIPRWEQGPSRFDEVGALHLPRPAVGRLSRLYRSTLWYYAERSLFAAMCAAVVAWRTRQQPFAAVYVREVICAAWWSALWGPLLGLPVVYEAHDLESWNPSRAKEAWAQPLLHLIDKLALTRAAHVTSLTAEFERVLIRIGWQTAARISVVPDGYDPERYFPRDRSASRRVLGIAEEHQLIVYTGLTFAYRGLDRLLDAIAALAPGYPALHVALVGGRPAEVATLRAQAEALGIAARVQLTGQVPQERTAHYLGAADVLVIPDTVTDVTASPLKLFEYMAAARAIVLPDLPALREVLAPEAGWYFARGDGAALADALDAALCDDAERRRRAARAHAAAPAYTYAARAAHVLAAIKHTSAVSQQTLM